MDHAEEILDVVLVTNDKSAKPVEPGKQPFHTPAFLVPPQLSAVLSFRFSASLMRCD